MYSRNCSIQLSQGGKAIRVLSNIARHVNCPICGKEALFATNTPWSPRLDIFTLSSRSTAPGLLASLKLGSSKSRYLSLFPNQQKMVGLGLSSLGTRLKFYNIRRKIVLSRRQALIYRAKEKKTLRHRCLTTLAGARVSIAFFRIHAAVAPCFRC